MLCLPTQHRFAFISNELFRRLVLLRHAFEFCVLDFVLDFLRREVEDATAIDLLGTGLFPVERSLGGNGHLERSKLLHADGVTVENHLLHLLDDAAHGTLTRSFAHARVGCHMLHELVETDLGVSD